MSTSSNQRASGTATAETLILIQLFTVWSPVTVFVAAGKTFGCPLTSSCRKHCQMNKFKGGQCEGNLRLVCKCIGGKRRRWRCRINHHHHQQQQRNRKKKILHGCLNWFSFFWSRFLPFLCLFSFCHFSLYISCLHTLSSPHTSVHFDTTTKYRHFVLSYSNRKNKKRKRTLLSSILKQCRCCFLD